MLSFHKDYTYKRGAGGLLPLCVSKGGPLEATGARGPRP